MSSAFGNLPPILAMALDDWNGQWMNRQQLLSRLAAGGASVFYSAGQWSIWDRHRPEWRRSPARGATRESDGVRIDAPPKWLPRFPAQPPLDALSLGLGSRRLARLAWGLGAKTGLLYLFHPSFEPYARHLTPGRLVYHAYDLFELTPRWTDALDRAERRLLAQADLCIASSEVTARRLEEKSGREVKFLANGADTRSFGQRPVEPPPNDLASIPRPRIGYAGRLSRKVDFELLATLAGRNPSWHFVMLGPAGSLDGATRQARAHCETLPNVHFLGSRPRTAMPGYLAGLDVGLILYRVGVGLWSEACYPLKFHEYLAADLPVVSPPLQALEPFAQVVRFACSAGQWEAGIRDALTAGRNSRGYRPALAARNDWQQRVAQLSGWLAGLTGACQAGPEFHPELEQNAHPK